MKIQDLWQDKDRLVKRLQTKQIIKGNSFRGETAGSKLGEESVVYAVIYLYIHKIYIYICIVWKNRCTEKRFCFFFQLWIFFHQVPFELLHIWLFPNIHSFRFVSTYLRCFPRHWNHRTWAWKQRPATIRWWAVEHSFEAWENALWHAVSFWRCV